MSAKCCTNQDALEQLAAASLVGTLGLFVGSGFPKALTAGKAPSWSTLLRLVAKNLEVDDVQDDLEKIRGWSFPRMASDIVERLANEIATEKRFAGASPNEKRIEAARRVKIEVCRQLAGLELAAPIASDMKKAVRALRVRWAITTNYDFFVEQMLKHPETLLPDQIFRHRRKCTPVFHLHGHLLHPDSIVLTEEDYIRALDHSAYAHTKLSLLLAESTTLMLGYALGDTNVHTAMAYAQSYRAPAPRFSDSDAGVVFVLNRTASPSNEPAVGTRGEIIVDAGDILSFLEEILEVRTKLHAKWKKARKQLSDSLTADDFGAKFVSSAKFRKEFIGPIRDIPAVLSADATVQLTREALAEESRKAGESDGWAHYRSWLDAVLDLLVLWPIATMPPVLFEYTAKELRALARYIEPTGKKRLGFAYDATDCWHARKSELKAKSSLVEALGFYARRESATELAGLLEGIS